VAQASDEVVAFFDTYSRAVDSNELAFFETAYGETFLFAGPAGAQAVKRDDFLMALPKREGFFKAVGLTASTIVSLEETPLDDTYSMVKAVWTMRFEKEPGHPVVDENPATYLLRRDGGALHIVLQLDHHDLAQRVRDLGLLPPAP